MPNLSIVLPAKNEEKRISKTLNVYGSYFDARKKELSIEILVVVNNSTDKTAKIVDDYSKKYPFIKKIETHYASGKGGAVALGFINATGDYIGFVDADGAIPPTEVSKLYSFISETSWLDGVIGRRDTSRTAMTIRRRLVSAIYNFYVKTLFDLKYIDTQCGVKIFTKDAAKQISAKLTSTGWAFDVNLLLLAKYLNLRVLDIPVIWKEKEGSKFSLYEAIIHLPLEFAILKRLQTFYSLKTAIVKLFKLEITPAKKGRKHILIYAWRDLKHPEMGGSEVYVHEIAKRLVKQYEVTVFTSKPSNLNYTDIIDGVNIIRRGGFLTVYFWAFYYYITYFSSNVDFVIDVENGIPFFTPLYAFKPKIMILHHMHKGQWFKQFSFPIAVVGYIIESFIMPFAYRKVPIVTVSPSTMSELKRVGFLDRLIYLAYNSIPAKTGHKFAKSETPVLLYHGRVKAYKRIEIAITALSKLTSLYPKIKMYVSGAGDHIDELQKYAKKLNVEKNIEFLGFVSDNKKWELMQKAWVFVMPSMKEGWGITIIEAASCATPAVGFDVPGVRDSIRNGQTGFLADDENDFYLKLRYLIETPKARKQMGVNCQSWSNMFSWNVSVKVFKTLIERQFKQKDLMSDKVYPWELDLRAESLTTLSNVK